MEWYYAAGTEQKGPLSQIDFDQLVRAGEITNRTLVWREGMTDWKPYGELIQVATGSQFVAGTGQPEVVCAECGQLFTQDQTIRLGGSYVCAGCKPRTMQKLSEGVAGVAGGASEAIRNEHIKHEASIRSVGYLYFISGAALILYGLVVCVTMHGLGMVIGAFLFILAGLQIWVGSGLRGLKRWARIPTGILSGLGLLSFPVGTLINGYILYLIFSQKGATIFSEDYQRVVQETPHVKYRTSIIVWVFLGLLVLALFGLVAAAILGSRH